MKREHLEPQEIETLLDGETGPTVSAARQHMEQCDACSALYAHALEQLGALELLPYRAPSTAFSTRVMSQVRVFEPLHVTILDAIQRLIPEGRGARLALGSSAAVMGLAITGLLIWVMARADALVFLANMTMERGRVATMGMAQSAAIGLVGEPTASALGMRGMRGIWFALGLLAASTLVSTFGLRLLASAARRGRS